jgi:RHS repeat-associated protein
MPVVMTMAGATYVLVYDQVGSLCIVADGAGNVLKRVDYDTFGNIITDTNSSLTVPFGFAGGLHDRDTGLVRFGYRDFDPDTGRWTAKDPIGFAGGDTDLYGYVFNNPVNFTDSFGLATDQHGMGPLSSNDNAVKRALKMLNQGKESGDADKMREAIEDAKKLLQDEIDDVAEKAKQCKGKARTKLLNRLKNLRGAKKVITRYFTPSLAVAPALNSIQSSFMQDPIGTVDLLRLD